MRSVAVVLLLVAGPVLGAACASGGASSLDGIAFAPSLEVDLSEMTRLSSGVYVEDLVEGVGEEVGLGDRVRMHYMGWLTDGTRFDSSLEDGEPFEFRVGRQEVIPGWDRGVRGMREGGQRRIVVPPELGYGARGAGDRVPPNSVLVFRLQVMEVR